MDYVDTLPWAFLFLMLVIVPSTKHRNRPKQGSECYTTAHTQQEIHQTLKWEQQKETINFGRFYTHAHTHTQLQHLKW